MKQFVRKRNDQKYDTMIRLIHESRINFEERQVYLKLFRRFWKCLEAYDEGKSYSEVLQLFFINGNPGKNKGHLQIRNIHLNT